MIDDEEGAQLLEGDEPGKGTGDRAGRRFVILFKDGWIGVSPTVLNLLVWFSSRGYETVVYMCERPEFYTPPPAPNVHYVMIPDSRSSPNALLVDRILSRLEMGRLHGLWRTVRFWALILVRELGARLSRKSGETLTLCVDVTSTVPAWLLSILLRRDYFYLCLELHSVQSGSYLRDLLIRRALRKASGHIVQDEARTEVISKFLGEELPNVYELPNPFFPHPPGTETKDPRMPNFFVEKLGLTPDRPIVLMAGMINNVTRCSDLARTIERVGDDIVFVFHEREAGGADRTVVEDIRSRESANLHLSLEPLDWTEVWRVYSSSTIGLVIYDPSTPNFEHILHASGKLAGFLRFGKPVIVSGSPQLIDGVIRYGVGLGLVDATDSGELRSKLQQVLDDYEAYSRRARECYRTVYDFDSRFPPIAAAMTHKGIDL